MGKIVLDNLAKVPQCLTESITRSKAQYRRLGNSGLRVSNPILGGLTLGSSRWLPWVLGEDKVIISLSPLLAIYNAHAHSFQALGILKSAYDRGINTVCFYLPFMHVWAFNNHLKVGHCQRLL